MERYVEGMPNYILRAEGFLALLLGAVIYHKLGFDWSTYFWFFFLPDISFLGYLVSPKFGSYSYNFAHSYVVPAVLLAVGLVLDQSALLHVALIWISHIGFDRALGFGLKYSRSFSYTHLGVIGKIEANI